MCFSIQRMLRVIGMSSHVVHTIMCSCCTTTCVKCITTQTSQWSNTILERSELDEHLGCLRSFRNKTTGCQVPKWFKQPNMQMCKQTQRHVRTAFEHPAQIKLRVRTGKNILHSGKRQVQPSNNMFHNRTLTITMQLGLTMPSSKLPSHTVLFQQAKVRGRGRSSR